MKKLLLLAALLAGMAASAQTLEKTYNGIGGFIKISPTETGYYTWDASNKVEVYSSSHVLIKSITLSGTYTNAVVYNVSKTAINADDKFEIVLMTFTPTTKTYIFNDQGQEIFSKEASYGGIFSTTSGLKLALSYGSPAKYEVYALSGTYLGKAEIKADDNNPVVYPVPGRDFVNIELGSFEKNAVLTVYSLSGQEISTQTVAGNLATIQTSGWNPGVYTYMLKTSENKHLTGRFIVSQ